MRSKRNNHASRKADDASSGVSALRRVLTIMQRPRVMQRLTIMRRLTITALLPLALFGCGIRHAAEVFAIDSLRAKAEANPGDPSAMRALAIGEILGHGGDPERGKEALERASALLPGDLELAFLQATTQYHHGHLDTALSEFQRVIERAAETQDSDAARFVAEASAATLSELVDDAPSFRELPDEFFEAYLDSTSPFSSSTRYLLGSLWMQKALRAGNRRLADEIAQRMGCVQNWTLAGPFGPFDLLGFDEDHPAEALGPMEAQYDLGGSRGVQPTRRLETIACSAHLGGGPVIAGGTSILESFVESDGGTYILRLETPNLVSLAVDGESHIVRDPRQEISPRTSYVPLNLSAGRHEITVKLATRHPNPVLSIALIPAPNAAEQPRLAEKPRLAAQPRLPEGTDPYGSYVRALLAMSRGDLMEAEASLGSKATSADASSLVKILAARVALSHPLRTPDLRRDTARKLFREAQERDSATWLPSLFLAQLTAAEGRHLSAIALLREAQTRFDEVAKLPLALHRLFMGRGWEGLSRQMIDRALAIHPHSCPALAAAFAHANRLDRVTQTGPLLERLMHCDARQTERLEWLVRGRNWAGAEAELARLESLTRAQNRARILSSRAQLLRGQGDLEQAQQTLAELAQLRPRSAIVQVDRSDLWLASQQDEEARQLMDRAFQESPADMAPLYWLQRALFDEDLFEDFRLDGAQVLEEFERSGRQYAEPQVLVLDYTVTRVFEDGSIIELTHNIFRLQSEEAVDAHGEFQIPARARLLRLHTIKADGRVLEPDPIEGKDTISLPGLMAGDYVEYEYIRLLEPKERYVDGAAGERFYFRNYETPFDRSELIVILPASMPLDIDPRGDAPRTHRTLADGLQILKWRRDESRPLVQEPSAVSPKEFFPSIRWGSRVSWRAMVDHARDLLSDKDPFDPAAQRLVRQILQDTRDPRKRAELLYSWVLTEIEHSGDFFGNAPAMLAARTGDRTRILNYLLNLAGIPSELILVRSASDDPTPTELADEERFDHSLLRVRLESETVFVDGSQRGATFGVLPPHLRAQPALRLLPNAPRIQVRANRPGEDRHLIELDVRLGLDSSANIDVVETYRGSAAAAWRTDLERIPHAVLNDRFEQAYLAKMLPGSHLTSLSIDGRTLEDASFLMSYAMEHADFGRQLDHAWVLPTLMPTHATARFTPIDQRTTTQLVSFPVDQQLELRIHLSDRSALANTRQTVEARYRDALFREESEWSEGTLIIRRTLQIPIMRVPVEEYGEFADFCRQIDVAEAREIRIARQPNSQERGSTNHVSGSEHLRQTAAHANVDVLQR
ncbi:MAG: DUF3857 domain-containing protein [Myxococcota bacterium]